MIRLSIPSLVCLLVAFLRSSAVALALHGGHTAVHGNSETVGRFLSGRVSHSARNSSTFSSLRSLDMHLDTGNASQDRGSRVGTDPTNTSQSQSEPRVFFLFLTISGIERQEIWRAFLEDQYMTQWSAFVHCKDVFVCRNLMTIAAKQVTTVSSEYCRDLVSPMVQLLNAAVAESRSPHDKFVFLSESTIPIKPFPYIYNALTQDQNSDFCLYSTDEWARFTIEQNLHTVVVKHSQWTVLNRNHAYALIRGWPVVKARLQSSMLAVPWYRDDTKGPAGAINVHEHTFGMCTDEWAIFATIYGAFVNNARYQMGRESLPGFSGPPVQVAGSVPTSQGICRTFVFWETTQFGDSDLMDAIKHDHTGTRLSCYPQCESSHPARFETLSDYGASALRRSRYLFARKFSGNVPTVDQFRHILIS